MARIGAPTSEEDERKGSEGKSNGLNLPTFLSNLISSTNFKFIFKRYQDININAKFQLM